jgi:hypothetical protein
MRPAIISGLCRCLLPLPARPQSTSLCEKTGLAIHERRRIIEIAPGRVNAGNSRVRRDRKNISRPSAVMLWRWVVDAICGGVWDESPSFDAIRRALVLSDGLNLGCHWLCQCSLLLTNQGKN